MAMKVLNHQRKRNSKDKIKPVQELFLMLTEVAVYARLYYEKKYAALVKNVRFHTMLTNIYQPDHQI